MQLNEESWESIGVAGALAQTYARDQKEFLPTLAVLLEQALPNQTEVERKPVRLFSSDKRVVGLTVYLGEDQFILRDQGAHHGILARHVKIVKGITLRTDDIRVEQWLDAVGGVITEMAKSNEQTLYALQNFMEIKSV